MREWFKNILRSRLVGQSRRVIRAHFDAAVTNDKNRRHWANADGLSPTPP